MIGSSAPVAEPLLQAMSKLLAAVQSGRDGRIDQAWTEANRAMAVAYEALAGESSARASWPHHLAEALELVECTLTLLENEIAMGRRRGMAGQTLSAMCSARDDLQALGALALSGADVARVASAFVERVKEAGTDSVGAVAEEFESLESALCTSGLRHDGAADGKGGADACLLSLDDAAGIARAFARERHPDADTVLLCGSAARNSAGAHSDIDIVILYRGLEGGAWRETESCCGRTVEAFCHDPGTLEYFFREVDAKSGRPSLPTMVAEGIAISGFPSTLADAAKALAHEVLDAGPPALSPEEVARRRYAITDLADDLRDARPRHETIASGAALYVQIADFALRATGRFSASGKGLPAALERMDALLEARFRLAFAALFERNDHAPLLRLIDDVLEPHGGPLREGYRIDAPADWRIGTDGETR